MAFTKIQPQQVQLPTFLSHSGHLTFSDASTGVEVYINESLTGDFNITGSLKVNDSEVLVTTTGNYSSELSKTLGGRQNIATGYHNIILNGSENSSISGDFNTIVNGKNSDFGSGDSYNTLIGGDAASFNDAITGSVIISDGLLGETADKNHALTLAFTSGITVKTPNSGTIFTHSVMFEDDVQFRGSSERIRIKNDLNVGGDSVVSGNMYHSGDNAYFKSHLNVDASHSGVFSGNVDVFGNLYLTGSIASDLTADGNSFLNNEVYLDDSGLAISTLFLTGGQESSIGGGGLFTEILTTGDYAGTALPTAGETKSAEIKFQISGFIFTVTGDLYKPS